MKKTKKKIRWLILSLMMLISIFILKPLTVCAALWGNDKDTKEIITFLDTHSNWLNYSDDILTNSLHTAGWWLVKGMYLLSVSLEKLVDKSLDLLTFSSGNLADVGSIGKSDLDIVSSGMINTIVIALFTLTLVFLGLKFIIGKTPPNFKSVGINLMISVVLIMGLPFIMWELGNVSKSFYTESKALATVNGNSKEESLSFGLVKNNTADLLYLTKNGYDPIKNSASNSEAKNNMSEKTFLLSGTSEILTKSVLEEIEPKDKYNEKETEALTYKLSTNLDGKLSAVKTEDSMWSVFSDSLKGGYQRFSIPTFTVLVGLIAISVAFLFSILTIVTATFELGVAKIVSVLVFATDLETGEKTKTVIQDIMTAYMVIAFTGVNLSLYSLFVSYIGSKDMNLILYVLCMIGATFILMKGSKTIMRYFGADVGLSSSMGQLIATGAMAKMALSGFGKAKEKKGQASKGDHQDTSDERGTDRTDKQFGDSIKNFKKNTGAVAKTMGEGIKSTANMTGTTIGYAKNRGLGGMVQDGKTEAASKTQDVLSNTKEKAKESIKDATDTLKKPFVSSKRGIDDMKSEFSKGHEKGTDMATINAGSQDIRKASNKGQGVSAVEELEKNTKRTDANAKGSTPKTHEVKERINASGQGADSIEELQKNTKRTDANTKGSTLKTHEVKERINASGQGADSIEELQKNVKQVNSKLNTGTGSHTTKERINTLSSNTTGTRNVSERVQSSPSSTTGTRNVSERVQSSPSSTTGTRNVTERVQTSPSSTTGTRNVTERVQSSPSSTTGTRNVTERVQSSSSSTTGTRNVSEQVKTTKEEQVVTERKTLSGYNKQIKQSSSQTKKKKADSLKDNPFFD